MIIQGKARGDRSFTAIPYYAWDHRQAGEMIVWIRQDGKSRQGDLAQSGWEKMLYRPLEPDALGASEPLSLMESAYPTASHCWVNDSVTALLDGLNPQSSGDHSLPRFTWWDHRGTEEWIQYDFSGEVEVSSVEVYWFDDSGTGACRVPASWELFYRINDQWLPVECRQPFGLEKDRFNRISFTAVNTRALRLCVRLAPGFSGGILEWRVH